MISLSWWEGGGEVWGNRNIDRVEGKDGEGGGGV